MKENYSEMCTIGLMRVLLSVTYKTIQSYTSAIHSRAKTHSYFLLKVFSPIQSYFVKIDQKKERQFSETGPSKTINISVHFIVRQSLLKRSFGSPLRNNDNISKCCRKTFSLARGKHGSTLYITVKITIPVYYN